MVWWPIAKPHHGGVTDLALDAAVEIDVIAAIPESTSMAGTPHIAT
ncbi:hypothetical protein ACH40F_39805 [Streptomyces sp. NPDC020794]